MTSIAATLLPLPLLGEAASAVNAADTTWMLISTALVLTMTPALAFFYGGMVRSKNALNTKMMSFTAMGFIGVLWALVGYTLAFGGGGRMIGGWQFLGLNGVGLEPNDSAKTIPAIVFMAYQATFAIITPALISGAIVERMRFSAYLVFITLWSLLVYSPVAHWVWGGGWLGGGEGNIGALDFAGGTVVHVNAGVAALVAALVLGPRKDYSRQALLPHNVPFVLLGAGLLWLGWFGFNGGSALMAGKLASLAFVNTMFALRRLVVWNLLDLFRTGKVTAIGTATAIVVGLVGITPAAGFIAPGAALVFGAIVALPSYFAILYRARTRLDDSLDVFSAHGLGGLTGALLTGVLASKLWNPDGADGGMIQLGKQAVAVLTALIYSGVLSFVLLKAIGLFVPLRADATEEGRGMDIVLHGEEAYTSGEGAVLLLEDEIIKPAPAPKAAVHVATAGAKP